MRYQSSNTYRNTAGTEASRDTLAVSSASAKWCKVQRWEWSVKSGRRGPRGQGSRTDEDVARKKKAVEAGGQSWCQENGLPNQTLDSGIGIRPASLRLHKVVYDDETQQHIEEDGGSDLSSNPCPGMEAISAQHPPRQSAPDQNSDDQYGSRIEKGRGEDQGVDEPDGKYRQIR